MAHITDLGFTLLELGKAIDDGDVRKQVHPEFPNLHIFNYCEDVQFRNRWNKITMACRGLIIDVNTGEIVARPWEKFFNLGQMDNRIDSTAPVEVTDKMDGSLGILYRDPNGQLAIATRGSFASEQAVEATQIWNESYSDTSVLDDYTFLFEILLPWNRIVVSYNYDSEYLQQGRRVLPQGSTRNDTGEHLHSAQDRLEDLPSVQGGGAEARQGEVSREAQGEREELAFSEQRESQRTQGSTLRQNSEENSRGEEGQALRGLQSDIPSGSDGLRPLAAVREEVQYRSGEELASVGAGNGEVRTGMRQLSQSEDVRYTQGNLVLLGAVHKQRGYYVGPEEAGAIINWQGPLTEVWKYDHFIDAISFPDRKGKEGVVIRSGRNIVKLKQADYVELHRIVTNLSPRTVWEMMGAGKTVADICAGIPDEFHKYVEDIGNDLLDEASRIQYASGIAYDKIVSDLIEKNKSLEFSRKQFAESASKSKFAKYLFLLLDGKAIDDVVWQNIKPRGDVKTLVRDEG